LKTLDVKAKDSKFLLRLQKAECLQLRQYVAALMSQLDSWESRLALEE
jgi:hypothetical protein